MTLMNSAGDRSVAPRSKKPLKLILGIGALAGVIALGSTLAANIKLNSGAPVEFGQGVAQTTACDDRVVVTPSSTFINSAESAGFIFSSFSVTDISSACNGKIFTIKAYKNGQNSPLDLYTTTGVANPFNEIQILDTAGAFTLVGAGLLSDDIQDISTGFNVNLSTGGRPVSTAAASAQDVDRITIESRDPIGAELPVVYKVGDRGPGGGIVFYVSAAPFTSHGSTCNTACRYLEAAPAGWNNLAKNDTGMLWSNNDSDFTGQNTSPSSEGFSTDEKFNWKIGQGFYNTSVMKVTGATSDAQAAVLAYSATDSSAGQWFIPSMNELNELCKYAHGQITGDPKVKCESGILKTETDDDLGGFVQDYYWSSTEYDSYTAWFQYFSNGFQADALKYGTNFVRPVRAF